MDDPFEAAFGCSYELKNFLLFFKGVVDFDLNKGSLLGKSSESNFIIIGNTKYDKDVRFLEFMRISPKDMDTPLYFSLHKPGECIVGQYTGIWTFNQQHLNPPSKNKSELEININPLHYSLN